MPRPLLSLCLKEDPDLGSPGENRDPENSCCRRLHRTMGKVGSSPAPPEAAEAGETACEGAMDARLEDVLTRTT